MKINKNIVNIIVALFMVFIVLLILIPLPPWLLDVMFVINIALSLVILLTTFFIKESLEFSVFPSMLLITTLFRLSLNVSSTRLILGNGGDAGSVVKTFGNFIIQGNIVVGFVVFIIIVVVQFVVITKGSERVAEVAARFTLDAMPGKQMAIDADLSSGLITEDESRIRRRKVQREADFYGAMDGASKFVKGDAIISIIVTFINLIGGIIIGMLIDGKPFNEVMQIYSLATVGDGLVSQLPALLISTATGLLVTRAASETNVSEDLSKQFLSQPFVLMIAGFVILALSFVPGFNPFFFWAIAGVLITAGFLVKKEQDKIPLSDQTVPEEMEEFAESETDYYKNIDNVYTLLNVEQIEMEFGYSLIPIVDEGSGGIFLDRIVMFRKQFALDMGMVVPSVRLRDNGQLNPNQYLIKLKGEDIAKGEVLVDHYLALDAGNVEEEVGGIDTIEPAFGIPAKWISESKRDEAELAGYTIIDPVSVIITHLSEIIKTYAFELLNRQDVSLLLENVKKINPAIVADVVPNIINIGDLQKILCNLLKESIPIRDLETILETIADYGVSLKDTDMLTEYVRQSLKRTITRKFSDGNQVKIITLDANIETIIMNGVKKSDHGSYLAIEPDVVQSIVSAMIEQVDKVKNIVNVPIILTSPIVRVYFKKMADQFYQGAVVLSFNEIDSSIQIQSLGNIAL